MVDAVYLALPVLVLEYEKKNFGRIIHNIMAFMDSFFNNA